jgi:ParB-like chromosome segregation protein Spo0J
MTIGTEIKYASVDDLYLDPKNPRLGRRHASPSLSQEKVLTLMRDWSLDELAVSFLESGFWPNEALVVVEEHLYGKTHQVVVEGNRRLAALKLLAAAKNNETLPSKWEEMAQEYEIPDQLLKKIPYVKVDSREDVSAFLGFRHVTGIKEWKPAEKAEYIAYLIDKEHLDYDQVRKKIGSKAPTVRRNYIAYRVLLQMEEQEAVDVDKVEEKFSVLFLSLRTSGVQKYLQIDIEADPKQAQRPVPKKHLADLTNFALWLFGNAKVPPLVTDSRYVDQFSTILGSEEAVRYLQETDKPSLDIAFRIAGGDEPELIKSIRRASENVQVALSAVHQYRKSLKVQSAIENFGRDAMQLLSVFPKVRQKVLKEVADA